MKLQWTFSKLTEHFLSQHCAACHIDFHFMIWKWRHDSHLECATCIPNWNFLWQFDIVTLIFDLLSSKLFHELQVTVETNSDCSVSLFSCCRHLIDRLTDGRMELTGVHCTIRHPTERVAPLILLVWAMITLLIMSSKVIYNQPDLSPLCTISVYIALFVVLLWIFWNCLWIG